MDWKEMLGQLREDPSLPAGDDVAQPAPEPILKKKDTLRVIVDKKGRKGKIATIVEGFTVSDEEVAEIAASLKKRLGTGGSSRDGRFSFRVTSPTGCVNSSLPKATGSSDTSK